MIHNTILVAGEPSVLSLLDSSAWLVAGLRTTVFCQARTSYKNEPCDHVFVALPRQRFGMTTQTPSIPEGQLPGRMQLTSAARGRASSSSSREGQSTSFSQAGGTPSVLQTGRTPAGPDPQAGQAQAATQVQAGQIQAVPQAGQIQAVPQAGQIQAVPQAGQAQAVPQAGQAQAAPQVVDFQLEFSLLRQQIERLQGRSIEGVKDEILQLAARPLPAFDQNRAVALLETLASQAQLQAHPKAEEFCYILQQGRPLAHLPRFKDVLQDLLGPPILKQINKSITGCLKDVAVVHQFTFPQAATRDQGPGEQEYPQYYQTQQSETINLVDSADDLDVKGVLRECLQREKVPCERYGLEEGRERQ
ncbi:Hypp3537 [Branchiostoma lanceolatum]|uniref:Hypp3537 protein n=1 Tax=Branchiostoma lanceolatum TaxID=7740 RepID=A0A8K0A015_BRALA|nr:Hypp3537 [Branchiostoma lanceolatum]